MPELEGRCGRHRRKKNMTKKEQIEIIKNVLIQTSIFSNDNQAWLEKAAKDLLKSLVKAGLVKPTKK